MLNAGFKEKRYGLKLRLNLLFLLLCVFVFLFIVIFDSKVNIADFLSSHYRYITNYDHYGSLEPIDSQESITQSFYLPVNASSIEILLSDELTGDVEFTFSDQNMNSLFCVHSDDCTVKDNWIEIPVIGDLNNETDETIDRLVYLNIAPLATNEGSNISFSNSFITVASTNTEHSLYVDNLKLNSNLVIRYKTGFDHIALLYILCFILFSALAIIFLSNGFTIRSFLLIYISLGLLFSFITPFPFNAIERNDTVKSFNFALNGYAYKDFEIIHSESNTKQEAGNWLPDQLLNPISFLDTSNAQEALKEDYSLYRCNNILVYSVPHLIISLFIRLLLRIGVNTKIIILLTRVLLVITSAVFLSYGIHFTKKYRKTVFLLALFPLVLLVSSTISSLLITYVCLLLFFSIVFTLKNDESVTCFQFHQKVIVLCSFFIFTSAFLPLFFAGFFALGIPGSKFKAHGKTLWCLFVALILCGSVALHAYRLLYINSLWVNLTDVIIFNFHSFCKRMADSIVNKMYCILYLKN